MLTDLIPEPFQFNPLKHHLAWIRDFASGWERTGDTAAIIRDIKHIGSSVMDVYAGTLTIPAILEQAGCFLKENLLFSHDGYRNWTGIRSSDYRSLHLSDASEWVLKYNSSNKRYIHIFPARSGPHTFRVKANTLKSALLYIILSGKDFISEEEINNARAFAGLSPVKELSESEAIFRMIEVLRS